LRRGLRWRQQSFRRGAGVAPRFEGNRGSRSVGWGSATNVAPKWMAGRISVPVKWSAEPGWRLLPDEQHRSTRGWRGTGRLGCCGYGGGQIWRSGIENPHPEATDLVNRLKEHNGELLFGWRAVAAPSSGVLRLEQSGRFTDIAYGAIILATGARERFLPFPGWTLPGVYGAGGLQAFVKSGFDIRKKRIVVAGTGPLLPAVAAHLREAGAHVPCVVEQAPIAGLARFSLNLVRGQTHKLIEAAGYAFKTVGIPYYTSSWVTSASGGDRLEKVTIHRGGRFLEVPCDMLAIGYHLAPNTELAQLLGCELHSGYAQVDILQRSSVEGVYCSGELTGIGGVEKAKVEGRIAGFAAARDFDRAKALFRQRDIHVKFAWDLDKAFALRDELRHLATSATVVCRCEDVTYEVLARCGSWREAKLHTRCGMGPCQGRICAPATKFLFGWSPPVPRPPIFPMEVDALGCCGNTVPES
jgi:NADPH-dependent 2,4-dienoyl-CoA reductase/sulfur reductase-like enzyme